MPNVRNRVNETAPPRVRQDREIDREIEDANTRGAPLLWVIEDILPPHRISIGPSGTTATSCHPRVSQVVARAANPQQGIEAGNPFEDSNGNLLPKDCALDREQTHALRIPPYTRCQSRKTRDTDGDPLRLATAGTRLRRNRVRRMFAH